MKHLSDAGGDPKPDGSHFLSADEFETVIRLAPLVSIDLVVRSEEGDILVGRRTNEPAKGLFFVPGGRIQKGETVEAAFRRIAQTELGLEQELSRARFLGVFNHFYNKNFFDKPGFGTHYVAMGYELTLPKSSVILDGKQHAESAWKSAAEILALPDAHEYTKAYLRVTR
jgi:colanic acid biosynthesis protein WcaH